MQAGELEQPLNPGATTAATSASIASSTAMATTSTGLPPTSAAANAAGAASNTGPGAPGNGTQFPLTVVGDSAQNAFPAVTSQQALFTDRADSQNALGALGGSSTHLFLTTDDAAQQAAQAAQPQQQVSPEQLRARKAAFGQAQDSIQDRPANTTMQPPHLAPANRPEDEEFLRRQQHLQQEQDRAAQSQPMQQAQNATFSQQQASRTQTVQAAGQFSQSQQQAQQQQREVQQNAASAIRPPGNAVPGAAEDAFNATQIGSTTVPAVQFGFEDPQTVRNRQSGQNVSQHPAAVLGFADGYMQQDGTTDARAQGREFSAQFQVNPSAMVASGMAYDMAKQEIDAAKGMATGVPHDPSMATPGMDPALQMAGRTVSKADGDMRSAAAAAAHPYVAGTVEKRVVCNVCGSLFGDAGSLKRHAARAHRAATGKGPVFCTHCSASLKNEQNLRRHVAVCHSGDQENRCDMCSASFSSRGSLRIHQQQVHAVPGQSKGANARNGRPGMPNRAGAPAARGTGRPRGGGIQKSSKSEKSYVCDMCSDTFKWKGNLKRHRELRHLQLRPFTCQVCQARFGTKSNMRVHLITHNNTSAAQK